MIYLKTDVGREALKNRSEAMPRKYHFPFLMCDGHRDSAEILSACSSHGFTSVDWYEMVQAGFIAPSETKAAATPTPSSNILGNDPTLSSPAKAEAYQKRVLAS